jgi:FkbM family methyltransferase
MTGVPDNRGNGCPGEMIVTSDQVRFHRVNLPCRQITEVSEYRFSDIRRDDRVLDIGANVGAFSLRAARLSPYVTAVEPLTIDPLKENIRLNAADVRVIEGALGDGSVCRISWDDLDRSVQTYTLGQLIAIAGGCDFLKCDCEGAEWKISPEDLLGIRRIEMELHLPPICPNINPALLDFIGQHFTFTLDRTPVHSALGVMGILHAVRK